jgi:hypothetical protein
MTFQILLTVGAGIYGYYLCYRKKKKQTITGSTKQNQANQSDDNHVDHQSEENTGQDAKENNLSEENTGQGAEENNRLENTKGKLAKDVKDTKKRWGRKLLLKSALFVGGVALLAAGIPYIKDKSDDNKGIDTKSQIEPKGTVTDTLTGLTWLQNTNCAGKKRDWETAKKDVEELNKEGKMNRNNCGDISNDGRHQTDWRLPNIKELQTLLAPSKKLIFSDNKFVFPNMKDHTYWSSTLYYDFGNPDSTDQVWYMDFSPDGDISISNKSESHYVLPVRGQMSYRDKE